MLFDSTRIGKLEVKNRLVRSATGERMVDKDGKATDELIKVYRNLAAGGVGTIITGHTSIDLRGRSGWQMMALENNDMIGPLQRLTRTVHEYEARVFIQLNHCGRYAPGGLIGQRPLAVWLDPNEEVRGQYPPEQIGPADIANLLNVFTNGVIRAREAGFDGVQIHAAHGYLISQFLSPYFNKRTDEWGGAVANRARFLLELVKMIRAKVGADFPIWVKMNCEDFIEGGLAVEDSIAVVRMLKDAGLDALEISGGITFDTVIRKGVPVVRLFECNELQPTIPGRKSLCSNGQSNKEPEAYFLPQAQKIRQALPGFPMILVGGIRSRKVMEMLLGEQGFNLVSMCRPLIRQPDLPLLMKKGNKDAECISCNLCLTKKTEPVKCRMIMKPEVK